MAAGVFTVRELLPSGLEGELFVWTSDISTDRPDGGARACPQGTWDQPGELLSVRTDYPGSDVPSEQVLGSMESPHSFSGVWDDRYNFRGYAVDTRRRFRAMCKRGNLVRIAFQGQNITCLIKTWNTPYRRDWDIRYTFTTSVHEDDNASNRGLDVDNKIKTSPVSLLGDAQDIADALVLVNDRAPRSNMAPDTVDLTTDALVAANQALDSLSDTLDQRDLNVPAPTNPISPFGRLASLFREVRDRAFDINQELLTVRADVELAVSTGKGVLDFEEWSRSMRFNARVLLGQSLDAELDMVDRDKPEITKIYRPHRGESLMAISRQFYGTPHQWHTISDANGLDSEVLNGDEILIIPELGGA